MTRAAAGDTIFALSSGRPPAGIAVMRVSGPAARDAIVALTGALPAPRRATLRMLRDGEELLDRALLLWLPGPASATGEDVAEFHLHGSRAVVAGVEFALAQLPGLRAAEAGEFTRRALLNGRIDLTEAEGLADLLAAETATQRRAALTLSGGALSREVAGWRERLLDVAALLEASLDFADEEDAASFAAPAVTATIGRLAAELEARLARPPAERLRDGVKIVIAGPPNAGKSTLLNALAGRNAAITSPIEGTTRDIIEVPVAIGGMPFVLIDTAGLRETGDAVEQEGVERAIDAAAAADIVLWLGDAPAPMTGATVLPLHARSEVPDRKSAAAGRLAISAVTGQNLDLLRDVVLDRARAILPAEGELTLNARHRAALARALAALARAAVTTEPLLIAEEVRSALSAFDAIVGACGIEDMLDRLFGAMCIGK